MNHHFVTILGLGTLTACQGPAKSGKKGPDTVAGSTETVHEAAQKETNTVPVEELEYSKDCTKDYDINASCSLDGTICPTPESRKGGVCQPPKFYRCEEGRWRAGPMPTCNPPPISRQPPK